MPLIEPKPTSLDYKLLGVTPGVTVSLLKRAYREKVKLWHPDQFQHKGDEDRRTAEEQFKAINGAYHNILAAMNQLETIVDSNKDAGVRSGLKPGAPFKTERSEAREDAFVKSEAAALWWRRKLFSGCKKGQDLFLDLWGLLKSKEGKCCLVAVLIGVFFALNWSAMFGNDTEKLMTDARGIPSVKREKIVAGSVEEEPSEENTRNTVSTSDDATIGSVRKPREPAPGYFSIGSSQQQVLEVQGKPSRVNGKTWFYNLSEIAFKDGRVERYDNFDGSLKIRMMPDRGALGNGKSFITLGSTKDEVLLVQGAPTRVSGNRWYYGFSELRFKDGRVESFDNFFGKLKISMTPSVAFSIKEQPTSFSVGSSKDEVLAVQGTPSGIQGGLWQYGSASIQFREDRVQSVFGDIAALRFVSHEDLAVGE